MYPVTSFTPPKDPDVAKVTHIISQHTKQYFIIVKPINQIQTHPILDIYVSIPEQQFYNLDFCLNRLRQNPFNIALINESKYYVCSNIIQVYACSGLSGL